MKITPQQHARLIAPYIMTDIYYVQKSKGKLSIKIPLEGVRYLDKALNNGVDKLLTEPYHLDCSDICLLLTPLSKISDEDIKKVVLYFYNLEIDLTDRLLKYWKQILMSSNVPSSVTSYLQLLNYDTTVFIEPNHPNNGLTLIELDLAIDKTTL